MRFRRPRAPRRSAADDDNIRTPAPARRGAGTTDVGGWSAVGRRADNQDRWFVDERVAVLSDGMGGHRGGGRAAELAVAVAAAELGGAPDLTPARVVAAFERANNAVRHAWSTEPGVADMGATLTIAASAGTTGSGAGGRWVVAHLGDSPAYLVTTGTTTELTVDHTMSAHLVTAGLLTAADAVAHPGRHILLRAIGSEPTTEVDLTEVEVAPGSALVLVTDGVSGVLSGEQIGEVIRGRRSAVAARELVERALGAGASDNVTAVVIRVASSPR